MLPSGPLREGTGAYFTGGDIPGIPAGGDGWNEGGREKEGGGEGLWSLRDWAVGTSLPSGPHFICSLIDI